MADIYKYEGLSDRDIEAAKYELNENPEQVNAHIESFRRWVKSMPHLKCPTDSKFLLMFLRVAKFDHAKAEKRLDNFCTVRASLRGCPEFFEFPRIDDPIIEKFLSTKQVIRLGKMDNGECLLFSDPRSWDPKELPLKVALPIILMAMEIVLQDELVQIHGLKFFMDLGGCSKSALDAWCDPKILKSITRIWQDCYPVRFKGQIVYKEPTLYTVIANIMEFFLSEKNKKRMHRIKDDIKKAFERFPGLKRLLPKDYGGHGLSIDEATEKWLKEIKDFYRKGYSWSSISVNESKRPVETVKYFAQYADYTGENVGTKGTYTKFNAY